MYRKNCYKCSRPSFSSSEQGEWNCPICGTDLSNLPFFDAVTLERISANSIPHHKKISSYKPQKVLLPSSWIQRS